MRRLFFTLFFISGFLANNLLNAQANDEDYLKFGGAVRYNIYDQSWNNDKTDPQFTWDVWRLNIDARTSGIDLSFEYRFYPAYDTHFLKHGYLGYAFSEDFYMKLGVSQVPFGITKYASHSWWFQIPYYVGLEDDYDMGIKFDYTGIHNLTLNVAYFHQPDPRGTPNYASRYAYDIIPVEADGDNPGASLKEVRQFNLRAAYNFTDNIEVGLSGQFGQNYNSVLRESESSNAFAAHLVADLGNFNFKGEYINYDYGAKDDAGNDLDKVRMGAYATSYNVAAKADIYVAGLSYSIDVDWGPISNVKPYVDYSVIVKSMSDYNNSEHLIPGFLVTAGGLNVHVDYALGKNNAWLGTWENGLAEGDPNADWKSRFNINFGYYF